MLVQESGRTVELTGPGGEPMGATIVVRGAYSTAYRSELHRQFLRRSRKQGPDTPEAELEDDRRRLVAVCVASWTGVTNAGEPLDCTADNVTRILAAAPWVLPQLEVAQNAPIRLTPAQEA